MMYIYCLSDTRGGVTDTHVISELLNNCKRIASMDSIKLSFINLKTNKFGIDDKSTLIYLLEPFHKDTIISDDYIANLAHTIYKNLKYYPRFYSIFIVGCLEQNYFNLLRKYIQIHYGDRGISFYNGASYNNVFLDLISRDAINKTKSLSIKNSSNEY